MRFILALAIFSSLLWMCELVVCKENMLFCRSNAAVFIPILLLQNLREICEGLVDHVLQLHCNGFMKHQFTAAFNLPRLRG